MAVSSVSGASSLGSAAASSATASGAMGREDFLKLLMTQLRNQNPLDPMKDTDFGAQLAQFSTLDGIQQLNTNFTQLLQLQGLTQGANLVGKTILFDKQGSSTPARGAVDSVRFDGGKVQLMVGGTAVELTQVRGIVG